jgi:prepilin-type N-terminal cleavage/methylation domain-containing protein
LFFYGSLMDMQEGHEMHTDLTVQNTRETEKGFSLLELLLVVGVGALLLLAGIGTYQLVTSGSTANNAVRLLATIKQQSQRAYQGQSAYDADMLPTLIAMQAFPSGVVSGAVANDPWGGAITVGAAANPTNFTVTFPAVPSAACIQIGTAFTESDTDFVSLDIGGAAINPVTTAAVAAACGAGGTASMAWTFF